MALRLRTCLSAASALLLVAGSLVASVAHAGGRDDLERFTRGLKGLDGQFTQDVFDSKGKRKESSTGRVALSAPRLFRWEYVKPYPQLIVADGKQVWVYDPDLQQATVRAQGVEEENSPLAALIDPKKLDRDYRTAEVKGEGGLNWLELRPKRAGGAGFDHALLGFDAKGQLSRMRIIDALGQRTDIVFKAWKRNPTFPATTFRFAPPKGVDVVGAG